MMRSAWFVRSAVFVAAAPVFFMAGACDRSENAAPPVTQPVTVDAPRRVVEEVVPPPPIKPAYSFAPGLREDYPRVVAFLQEFLETCLAGDYAGYRQLASRKREPESRERFQAVYHAIRALHVAQIEPLDLPRLSEQVYRVICSVELDPESKARLRRRSDEVAILVLREQGTWRMLPAPAELQPPPETTRPASQPTTTSAPSYPWDEEGDF